MVDNAQDRIKASLLGFAVGDAMGITEFMTPAEIRKKYGKVTEMLGGGWLKLRPGEVTDDSCMMITITRSLVANNGIPDYMDMADRLLAWLDTNPKDVGLACRRGLEVYRKTGSLVNGDDTTLGNGGLLRVLGFALAGRTWQEAMRHVELTHNASLQARAVQSYVHMLHIAVSGGSKREIMDGKHGGHIRLRGVTNNRGDVLNSLSSAFDSFFSTETFEDSIIMAVNRGGDADSVSALTGGLAGAHFGLRAIPSRWLDVLDKDVHSELVELAEQLATTK